MLPILPDHHGKVTAGVILRALAAAVAVIAIAGCSAGGTPAPAPTATVTVTAPAAASPSASTTAKTLTREQAAKRYRKIIKPFNRASENCWKAAKPLEEGGWYESDRALMGKVRRACKALPAANKKLVEQLQGTAWPADAENDMGDVIALAQAEQFAFRQMAKAQTPDDWYEAMENLPADDGSADRVRARFGLPTRDDE